MGIDFADINRDGHDDFLVVDMLSRAHRRRITQNQVAEAPFEAHANAFERAQLKRNVLQINRGDGTYAEIAHVSGLDASEWSWTAVFLDVNLDGYEDVLIPTGHDFDTQDSDVQERLSARGPATRERISGRLLEYPRLSLPMQAFRNLGDLHFKEAGREWGFHRVGVKHGIACADLDNDGDLDVITNDLNDEAGLYQNDGVRPRVAVRLKGSGANTRGIGSKIWLYGGAVPVQSQEVICGGSYLSCDDAMRVFAAGTQTNRMRIEVRWRSGKRSVVEGVRANREYEIDEAGEEESSKLKAQSSREHPTSNIEHPTSNIRHPTSNIQHPTSNIQHPTSNIQHRTSTSNIDIERLTSNSQHSRFSKLRSGQATGTCLAFLSDNVVSRVTV